MGRLARQLAMETTCGAPSAAASLAPASSGSALAKEMALDMGLPIASGALVAVAFMPPPLGLAAWIALVPFAAALARPRGSFELYAGAYLGGLLLDLHALDFIRTRLNGAGLTGSHAGDWFVNAAVWATAWPAMLAFGRAFLARAKVSMWLALPIIWVSGEFLRQQLGWVVTWSPFPWLQIGGTQAPYLHLIQIADLGGVWAVAAVIAAVNGALFDAIASRRWKYLALAAVIFGANWLYGEIRIRETETASGPSVALVRNSRGAVTKPDSPVDILLWSETSYGSINGADTQELKAIGAQAEAVDSALVIGAARIEGTGHYNSAFVFDPARGYVGCYDKCFLVPWSEFTPWSGLGLPRRGAQLTSGNSTPVFQVKDHTCAVSICYDICFAELFRGFQPKPDFFLACSREASDITGFVARNLLNMTRLRAVENRRSFVRNVEGGFSGLVTSTGQYVVPQAARGNVPARIESIPLDRRWTLASLAGDWLPLCSCAVVGGTILVRRRRPRNGATNASLG